MSAAGPTYSEIPFSEPSWYFDPASSPFYTQTHIEFQRKVRAFVEKELIPHVASWEESGLLPVKELIAKAIAAGVYAPFWPAEFGGGPAPENADAFHELILVDELARCAAGGVQACLWSFGIALPPILQFGSEQLKRKVLPAVLRGERTAALAVTEPWVGSDVAQLRTSAVKCSSHYVVNGAKKFITNGCEADFLTVAVRTGDAGAKGISLLLVERATPGVKVRRLVTQGWWSSNTAYIEFNDVHVPLANLIGEENNGFRAIMLNFNKERFGIAALSNRYARVCIEEAIRFARQRSTFGRRLIGHQVIRHKLAEMIARAECVHALLEQLCVQFNRRSDPQTLAARLALAKVQATQTLDFCAREASQILGGNSYIRGGVGEKVERIYRETRVNSIGGGSAEIMYDLFARLAKL